MAWGTAGWEFAYNHCETQDNLLEQTSKLLKNNDRTGINIFQLALDVRNYELKIKIGYLYEHYNIPNKSKYGKGLCVCFAAE